jgi:heat shock protein HslJ
MAGKKSFLGLVTAVALAGSLSGAAAAQDMPSPPEGQAWTLTAYTDEAGLATVPEDLSASLLLADGVASGSTGCNRFSGSYELDGASLNIAPELALTQMACEPAAETLQDRYLALLPTTASWQSTAEGIQLLDAGGAVILEYAAGEPDLSTVVALLEQLRAEVSELQSRVDALEAGGAADSGTQAGDSATASKPAAPRSRGRVRTTFPEWMRDGLPPDQIEDLNRDVVRWRDRADDEDGYRVYARRGFCELRPGADPNQALDEDDFRRSRTKAVLIDELPADTTRYRPDHEGIDAALPVVPESPYSNDEFYDLYVAAFNDAGETKPVRVASFFLTPEFRCP